MIARPFSDLTKLTGSKANSAMTLYAKELRQADNSPADTNTEKDLVEVRYDATKLTARLKAGGSFESRFENGEGTTVNVADRTAYSSGDSNYELTSVTKSSQGAYSGHRFSAWSSSRDLLGGAQLPAEEAEFLFNLREPGLRPK